MESVFLFVAQQIAGYGINKGLDTVFNNKQDLSDHLFKLIQNTIKSYQEKYPQDDHGGKFSFYKSEILIQEFLKFRLFSKKGYSFNVDKVQKALEKNPNIIKPSPAEIESFFAIFDGFVNGDEKLKILEIEAFHKEAIFQIYDQVESVLNLLEVHLVEIIPLLEDEYQDLINSCFDDLKRLKPRTALSSLNRLEQRFEINSKHVSKKLHASLNYLKGICLEATGETNECFECFIKAYNYAPENLKYVERACISYYFIKDKKYKELKSEIESKDPFNAIAWAISTLESSNPISFISNSVSLIVLNKNYYKRLIFNNYKSQNFEETIELIKVLNVDKVLKDIPEFINYDNLHHWSFVLNILWVQFISNNEIPFLGFISKDEKNIQLLELSKKLGEAILDSELGNSYNAITFMYYWIQSELDHTSSTLSNLEKAYNSLKEKDAFRTMLFANSIQKHKGTKEGIKIIDAFEGEVNENLISLKTYCQLDDPEKGDGLGYFEFIEEVSELNIKNVCNYLVPILSVGKVSNGDLISRLDEINFSKIEYEKLVYCLVDTLDINKSSVGLERIKDIEKQIEDEGLKFFVAILYYNNGYFIDCIEYLKLYVDENKEGRDLFLYLRALNSSQEGNQLDLLRLLKKWRKTFSFNEYLLKIELELQQILKDWEEILVITRYALSKLPNNELFYTLYIISLANLSDKEKLFEELDKISVFKFNSTDNLLDIVSVLIRFKFFEEGLELIYQKALNKDDSMARMNYFVLTTNVPEGYLKELKVVETGCYVKFQINNDTETFYIDDASKNPIVSKSIGSKTGDSFTIQNPLTVKLKHVKILRIMNKYLALFDQILEEAHSSFSNLPMQSFNFETNDIKGFEKALIDNFGVAEDERRKGREQSFNEYYSFNKSLTELVNENFEGSYIDSFYYLTSSEGDGFMIKPLKYVDSGCDSEKKVIDLSSGLLFYELGERLGLEYEGFVVSENVYNQIETLIEKTNSTRNSKITLSLSNYKVTPHFYSDSFHDDRIEFLTKIKKWFENNCISESVEEKINVIRPLYYDGKFTNQLEYIVDNAFLSQREGYQLITDDLIYQKMLRVVNSATTEKYLLEKFPSRKNEILETLLLFRYSGLSVNADVIYSAYISNHKEGYAHVYSYALRNLCSAQNFNSFNVFIAVDFLKKIALNAVITQEQFKREATTLFALLIPSFPNVGFVIALRNRIQQQFNLLGEYLHIALYALLDAININNSKN